MINSSLVVMYMLHLIIQILIIEFMVVKSENYDNIKYNYVLKFKFSSIFLHNNIQQLLGVKIS